MATLKIEIKEDNKMTTYTMDTTETEKLAKAACESVKNSEVCKNVENFLKNTFKKEVYTKETKDVNELKQK